MSAGDAIFSTTVHSYVVILNRDNLTEEGYFDLSKIKNLRIYNNGFLRALRKKYNKTQLQIAQLLNIPLRTLIGWESYGKCLPFAKLVSLCGQLQIKKAELFKLIRGTKLTYGMHHGKNKLKLPFRPQEFILYKYLIPIKNNRTYLIKSAPQRVKELILENYSIDTIAFKKNRLITINSYLLHEFLKTFYTYKKRIDLKFPLSEETTGFLEKRIDLTKAIIIPLALSDGGEKPGRRLFFSGTSKVVHDLWSDALYYSYNLLPSSYLLPYKNIFVTTHNIPENILSDIKRYCPKFKTSPVKQTKENYLKMQQPTIQFLFDAPKEEQKIALRLWATTEGSIGINLDKRKGFIYPSLKIACAHPNLLFQLNNLAEINGIHFQVIGEKNNWSGLSALNTYSISGTLNFLRMGGFFEVQIAQSRSPYFGGLNKQDVLLGILEYIHRQRANNLRCSDKREAYLAIANIVKNKQFNNATHYLNLFKNNL